MQFEAKLWIEDHVFERIGDLCYVSLVQAQSQPIYDNSICNYKHEENIHYGQTEEQAESYLNKTRFTLLFQSVMTEKMVL